MLLIKTVSLRSYCRKRMLNTFVNNFDFYLDIFIFSLIKSLSCNKTLKVLGL